MVFELPREGTQLRVAVNAQVSAFTANEAFHFYGLFEHGATRLMRSRRGGGDAEMLLEVDGELTALGETSAFLAGTVRTNEGNTVVVFHGAS